VCICVCGEWRGMCTCVMIEVECECVSVYECIHVCMHVFGRISVCVYLGTPREAGTEQRSVETPRRRWRGRDEGERWADKRGRGRDEGERWVDKRGREGKRD
jgi:hypothetical protein